MEKQSDIIRSKCSGVSWYVLTREIQRNVAQDEYKYVKIHDKKLSQLTKGKSIPFTHDEVIRNLSSQTLSNDELDILKNGLSFSIPPAFLKKTDVFAQFDMINKFMTKELKDAKNSPILKSELSHLANSYVYKYSPSQSTLKKHGVLKRLRSNKDIVILRPDKGNGIVVLNRTDYNKAIMNIINDKTKFRTLDTDLTIQREQSLQRYLRKLKKKNFFTKEEYKFVYPKGSQPARIYGLPKIHKVPNNVIPPLRPIVSAINTYNYNLSKFLGKLLSPHLPDEHSAKDTFTFIEDIKKVSLENKFLVSYDVTSLFTNIPLEETIDLAINLIMENKPRLKITKTQLKKLFVIATSQTHFIFENNYYDQIDGVAMGSPLAPILANLFMGHHERLWLQDCSNCKPDFYKRYVDDIFAVFENEEKALKFFDYINNKHPNIKFTMEKEQDKQIAFLDVLINNNDSLKTSIFHKKTYTGLLLNYLSFTPSVYKFGLIRTLIDRTYKINNTWTGFDLDMKQLKTVLSKNQYPSNVVDSEVKEYLHKVINPKDTDEQKTEPITRFFKLPFIGSYSTLVKKKISSLAKKYCKEINVKIVFTSKKVGSFFSPKDCLPNELKSFVVYKFQCASCEASYVGETYRHISTRIHEHLRTDKKSHVYKHIHSSPVCKETASADCFSILDTASTIYQLKVKEGLHISWEKPSLNKQKKHYIVSISV